MWQHGVTKGCGGSISLIVVPGMQALWAPETLFSICVEGGGSSEDEKLSFFKQDT